MTNMKLLRVKEHTVIGVAFDNPTEFYFHVFSNCGHKAGLNLDYEEMCNLKEAVDSALAEYDKYFGPKPKTDDQMPSVGKCGKCGHEHPSIIRLCMACTNKEENNARR